MVYRHLRAKQQIIVHPAYIGVRLIGLSQQDAGEIFRQRQLLRSGRSSQQAVNAMLFHQLMHRVGADEHHVTMAAIGFFFQAELTVAFENAAVGVGTVHIQNQRQHAGMAASQTSGVGVGVIVQLTDRCKNSIPGFRTDRCFSAENSGNSGCMYARHAGYVLQGSGHGVLLLNLRM